jgi:DNA-binding protein Fis
MGIDIAWHGNSNSDKKAVKIQPNQAGQSEKPLKQPLKKALKSY